MQTDCTSLSLTTSIKLLALLRYSTARTTTSLTWTTCCLCSPRAPPSRPSTSTSTWTPCGLSTRRDWYVAIMGACIVLFNSEQNAQFVEAASHPDLYTSYIVSIPAIDAVICVYLCKCFYCRIAKAIGLLQHLSNFVNCKSLLTHGNQVFDGVVQLARDAAAGSNKNEQ